MLLTSGGGSSGSNSGNGSGSAASAMNPANTGTEDDLNEQQLFETIPLNFLCPITHELLQDPVVRANL